MLEKNISRVLIDEEVIKNRIDVLADKIIEHYNGEEFTIVALMKGALVFTADLFRRMPVELEIELLNVRSYQGAVSTGNLEFLDSQLPQVKNKNVLLLDDILDTGLTLHKVSEKMHELGAKSVQSCVLLSKAKQREQYKKADFEGFVIGDEFVVGYGLDYQGKYRNLPYIGVFSGE